ncbi:MAG: cellulase family glycosylhydrolase [Bryobacterales bacterium]|nr:cellulase family glycosylhydrolase [Bryobacterales bacterium]
MPASKLRDASIRRLPQLGTRGRSIVREDTGATVRLCGVNLSSLEYSEPGSLGFLRASKITREEVLRLTQELGANILRLPFNQDWALGGRGEFTAEDYLSALDEVIGWAVEGGAYTLLDLQWLDADNPRGGPRQFVAPLPDTGSIAVWNRLAMRYRGCPCVLYDIFNEPHDRLPGDPFPLRHPDGSAYLLPWRRKVYARNWRPWALKLIDTIRQVHPLSLIFVSGINWGYDLRGVKLDRANLVYSSHAYPDKRPEWETAFGRIAETVPVFIGEFGGEEKDLAWGRELMAYLDEKGFGWAAWSWRDWPHLQREGRLTPFGTLVAGGLRRELAARGGPFDSPQRPDSAPREDLARRSGLVPS